MHEKVRGRVKPGQLLLRQKPAQSNRLADAQLPRQLLDLPLHRPLAGQGETRLRVAALKPGKGAERGDDPLFRNEPAGLHEMPRSVCRRVAPGQGKIFQRNAGAVDPDFLRGTPQGLQSLRERMRARQEQRRDLEQLAELAFVSRLVLTQHHIRTVKGDHGRLAPALNEGKQMHAGMSEVDVH